MHATCDKEARALEEHMEKDIRLNTGETLADPARPYVRKAKLDLVVLRYMAQRIGLAIAR